MRDKACDSITIIQSDDDKSYNRGFLTMAVERRKSSLPARKLQEGLFCGEGGVCPEL